MRLSKKSGDVGRERRQHVDPLIGAVGARDQLAVVVEVLQPKRAQTLGQP